jgi:hypothetical protein
MRRRLLRLLPLAICLAPHALPAQDKGKPSGTPYYPLKVGTRWVYKSGTHTITVRVTKEELVGGVRCARVEAVEGKEVHVEHVAVRPDGVFKYRADGDDIKPPLCFLKLPPKAGATWKAEAEVRGLAVTATFALAAGEVTVPSGRYKAVTVTAPDFQTGGRKMPVTYWFAAGVGLVRQRALVGGSEVVLELESFSAPK